ncbi:carbamoyltransferase family protein [Aurantiacibacter poecillastricola]|uniref:carbamoyltransferase family protein n=1 Tax=Aurantiacibacter poecillastricola TaxID=3064385 RepID=UPI00273D8ADC|nr:carbamoyltransferase [Aurantiacibacter sp. 219JJ12-13]MDP5263165.1 carbamoyltransferase [Aurantiacibacter sp. 219JJ12-13]
MRILGISAFYHDSAAALVVDGNVTAAAQEERFTRRKHDPRFPKEAIAYCLAEAGCTLADVDHVVFYEKPFPKFERLLESYFATVPQGFSSFRVAMPLWIKDKLFQKDLLKEELEKLPGGSGWNGSLLFTEHHQSHAASAFFPSPYESAAVLTMDGVGEWCTTSLGHGSGNRLNIAKELHFPHSLGLLYSAFTYYTGFRVNSGEYKVMGLAPYGTPRFVQAILDNIVDVKEDGTFHLAQRYFNYVSGLTMTSEAFHELFGAPPRKPEEELTQREMDLAASIQAVTEMIVLRLARSIRVDTGERNLCLAGGVALNCVANGKLLREGIFDSIWIQPAAGDAGGALGAALAVWHQYAGQPRSVRQDRRDTMSGSYLGPEFSQDEIEQRLQNIGAKFDVRDEKDVTDQTADALAEGKAVGWMQGRMEFGPRALGGRSILGDPRSPTMQKTLNLKVKYRESFRPFAPSVKRESVSEWFDHDGDSPYMLIVGDIAKDRQRAMTEEQQALFGIDKLNIARSEIPAVTHVDYSARIQTVHRETNPRYWDLLSAFEKRTNCPVLINTSFNVRGEPIVCTPEDAFHCFMGTGLDHLTVGNCVLTKEQQDPALARDYKNEFALD